MDQKYDDFYSFLNNEGYTIIKCSHEHQTDYLINFLNIGNNKIIAVNRDLKGILKDIDVEVLDLDFTSIVKMYGAVHCATQVSRKKTN